MEYKIFIKLSIEDDWPPCGTEWVWAEKVSNSESLFQINNIPFFHKTISFKDIVFTKRNEGLIWFDKLHKISRYSVIEVLIVSASNRKKFNSYLNELSIENNEKIIYEFSEDFFIYVIAINDLLLFKEVQDYLNLKSIEGEFEYEIRFNRFE